MDVSWLLLLVGVIAVVGLIGLAGLAVVLFLTLGKKNRQPEEE